MARINIVDPAQATGKSKELLTALPPKISSQPGESAGELSRGSAGLDGV
jgi:hypothetical protein